MKGKYLTAAAAAASLLLFAACTPSQTPTPPTTDTGTGTVSLAPPPTDTSSGTVTISPPAAGNKASVSLVDAAVKVKDVCTLVPMDLAAKIVSNARAPQSQPFPMNICTISNGTSVLEVTLHPYDTGGYENGGWTNAEFISGLGQGAYHEILSAANPDDSYLTVLLSKDAGELYVEVAGHDGKNHKDDAIAVAKAILDKLASQ